MGACVQPLPDRQPQLEAGDTEIVDIIHDFGYLHEEFHIHYTHAPLAEIIPEAQTVRWSTRTHTSSWNQGTAIYLLLNQTWLTAEPIVGIPGHCTGTWYTNGGELTVEQWNSLLTTPNPYIDFPPGTNLQIVCATPYGPFGQQPPEPCSFGGDIVEIRFRVPVTVPQAAGLRLWTEDLCTPAVFTEVTGEELHSLGADTNMYKPGYTYLLSSEPVRATHDSPTHAAGGPLEEHCKHHIGWLAEDGSGYTRAVWGSKTTGVILCHKGYETATPIDGESTAEGYSRWVGATHNPYWTELILHSYPPTCGGPV